MVFEIVIAYQRYTQGATFGTKFGRVTQKWHRWHAAAPKWLKIQNFERKVVELRSWQHLIGLDELIILVYKKVDFGQKLTELWPKNHTPKYGRDARLGLKNGHKMAKFQYFCMGQSLYVIWP